MAPEEVVEAGLVSGEARYDLALVVRVGEVERDGRTQTAQVVVLGAYGLASAPDTATVTFADLADTPEPVDSLASGSSYFIPIFRVGPLGEPNYASSCDPVAEVSQPEATALELAAVAAESGLEFSLPAQEGEGGAATAAVLVVLAALLFWTFSRVRRNREGSAAVSPGRPRPRSDG